MNVVFTNLQKSHKPIMIVFRYILLVGVIILGISRLRFSLLLLIDPNSYQSRDITQIYLMTKALFTGLNPYLPLNELAVKFIGVFPYFPHPAPYPPFVAVLFLPIHLLSPQILAVVWFIIELAFLAIVSILLTYVWRGHINLIVSAIVLFILLAFYPVMADLGVGQLSIMLTVFLLLTYVALRTRRSLLAGVLLGLSVAIKLITWPLIIYLLIKKDWKAVISSIVTVLAANLLALSVMGFDHFTYYYLKVSSIAFETYHSFFANYSLFTLGYRLFEGTNSSIFVYNYHVSPLLNVPALALPVSTMLVIGFLATSMIKAVKHPDFDSAFAILVLLVVIISPITWDHYFVMICFSLVVLLRSLARGGLTDLEAILLIGITLLLLFFNDRILLTVIMLNGGSEMLQARHGHITFLSSLLFWIPTIELIVLSVLLWQMNHVPRQAEVINDKIPQDHIATGHGPVRKLMVHPKGFVMRCIQRLKISFL